jgi:hypothetical protein
MRAKGITYDTGFAPAGNLSRKAFDPDVVRREMQIIADDLHCTAVRVSGSVAGRLTIAAQLAAAAGLDVWFAPFPCDMTTEAMLSFLSDCAGRAEDVRGRSAHEVVFVLGCEVSVAAEGFLPGASIYQRLASLAAPGPELIASYTTLLNRMNAFLAEAAGSARRQFGGRITYASGMWEQVDWSPFDIVSVDAYRDQSNATTYRQQLHAYLAHGKPVAATEFGCCTYRGAAARGGSGWAIIDSRADPQRLNGNYVRDEQEQVTYARDLLQMFEEEGLDAAFWFTFAGYELPHRRDPQFDLDMASYGVVKILENGHGVVYPDMSWEPKSVFWRLSTAYGPRSH